VGGWVVVSWSEIWFYNYIPNPLACKSGQETSSQNGEVGCCAERLLFSGYFVVLIDEREKEKRERR
jgi:hypothetical protein